MHNSDTVCNTMIDVVQCRQQRGTILHRSSEMHQLDPDDYDEEVGSLSPLVDVFVIENSPRVFEAFTLLSRDGFEVVWDRIGVHILTDWSFGRGSRCRITPRDVFLLHSLFTIYLKMGKSWCYIWNDSVNMIEDLLEGIIDMCTYIEGGVWKRGVH